MRGKIIILLLLLLQASLIACNNSISEIGSNLFTNSLFNINYVDSVTVKISTVLNDSLITSNTGRLLVGYHNDEKLGPITCKSIFQVGLAGGVSLDRHTTDYVGLRLFLKRDGYSYYDTTKVQTISVYRLSKGLKLFNGFLFNRSRFKIDSEPLGSLTFLPRPHNKDSLEIALPDDLGRQLMTMAQTNDIRLSTNSLFLEFFKGLVLIPDSLSSTNMIGFSVQPEMRLYYHDETSTSDLPRHISFVVGSNIYFNNVYANRSSTALRSINKKNDAVSSTASDHEAYLQSGVGLGIRVEMPHLRDFLATDRSFVVTRAILELVPAKDVESHSVLPPVLYIFRVDALNQLLSPAPQGGTLVKDLDLGINTHYTADITNFVNSQIQTDAFNKNALLILLDDKQYRSTVNRLYIGDKQSLYALKIKLYYVSLSNQ